ncbi:PadR family transcriptional regulator [Bacillus sp. CGMCC 1.16541]|uniref:PadR family transcriptional regulator n=1 Tax=Bacillus sp. CGMCC 1.16541 TaxID=2185143 RepID=UPI000D729921|nr:PadR family transcriptional regulator [Bacillus sp. CGMCC 1.16541]
MEKQLKNLKAVMKKNSFKELQFTDKHRQRVLNEIKKPNQSDEEVLLAILQLLTHKKTGFELMNHLRSRGIHRFEDEQGFLYTLLHGLEQKQYVKAEWNDSQTKYYVLNNKGRKVLQKAESKSSAFLVKELLQGGY